MQERLKLILPIITLFIALILLSFSGREKDRHGSPLSSVMMEVVGPVERFLSSSGRLVENIWRNYFHLINVKLENDNLKEIIDAQDRRINQLIEHEVGNERLHQLLDFKENNYDLNLKVAKVIAWDPGPWFRSIVINLGSKDGVISDQAVLHPKGVVGRVVEVTPHYSRVLLASDFNSSIDAFIQRTRAAGILSGQGSGPFVLKYVRKDEDVRLGDVVISSGLDGFFPRGMVMGTVSKVDRQNADLFVSVEVLPSVPFDRLEEVLIVQNQTPPIDWLSTGPRLRPLISVITEERRENAEK